MTHYRVLIDLPRNPFIIGSLLAAMDADPYSRNTGRANGRRHGQARKADPDAAVYELPGACTFGSEDFR